MKTLILAAMLCLSIAPTVTVVYTLTENVVQSVKLETARALTAAADADVEAHNADVVEGEQR